MLRYLVLLLAAIAVISAQTMEPMRTEDHDMKDDEGEHMEPEPEGEHEPEPEGEHEPEPEGDHDMMMCHMDSDCGMGRCHDGMCRCPPNYYGAHCETHKPLKCYTCDGYVSEYSSCASGMGMNHDTDVQVCMPNQTYCMTEIWHQDGVQWIKRHGCATHCWNKMDCSPNNRESCISCCQYDYCIGYEKEMMAASSDVITPSIVVVSVVSLIASLF
ncbi:uncharacterized protein [Ptychodera flava]|uniref:uncharacterized protein n=1 Tax=Ptychodera flava TaxID=63121 RepID=UPI00396A8F4E